jgi:hypothetical protein
MISGSGIGMIVFLNVGVRRLKLFNRDIGINANIFTFK